MLKNSQNIYDELKSTVVCHLSSWNDQIRWWRGPRPLEIFTGSIPPFWVKQKANSIVTRVKIMIRFHDEKS